MKAILRSTIALLLIGIWVGCEGQEGAEVEPADTVMTEQQPGMAEGDTFSVTLTGDAQVPGPGDPEGSGEASVSLNVQEQQVCYEIELEGIEPTAAHIHSGSTGASGPPVVPLNIEEGLTGCVDADSAVIGQIQQNPSGYYLNVHTAEYGAGAVRGQLEGG